MTGAELLAQIEEWKRLHLEACTFTLVRQVETKQQTEERTGRRLVQGPPKIFVLDRKPT